MNILRIVSLQFALLLSLFWFPSKVLADTPPPGPTCGNSKKWADYPPDYAFGKDGDENNPNGNDGWPGDTPLDTPGKPPGVNQAGGPGGDGFGTGSGGPGGSGGN